MATHTIRLSSEFTFTQVGNSMSTRASFDGKVLTVEWKGQTQGYPATMGDRVQIRCDGGFPGVLVMRPPSNSVALAAWERRFFSKQRVLDAVALKKAAIDAESPVSVYLAKNGRCGVSYRSVMGGQRGVPFRWFASQDAEPEDVETLIDVALGDSAMHLYSAMEQGYSDGASVVDTDFLRRTAAQREDLQSRKAALMDQYYGLSDQRQALCKAMEASLYREGAKPSFAKLSIAELSDYLARREELAPSLAEYNRLSREIAALHTQLVALTEEAESVLGKGCWEEQSNYLVFLRRDPNAEPNLTWWKILTHLSGVENFSPDQCEKIEYQEYAELRESGAEVWLAEKGHYWNDNELYVVIVEGRVVALRQGGTGPNSYYKC